MKNRLFSYGWAVAITLLVHLDWHLGRSGHHRLSGGFPLHWLLAVVFAALFAWLLVRKGSFYSQAAFTVITFAGFILGQIVEPMGEVILYRESIGAVYANGRWSVFAAFAAAWMITGAAVYLAAFVRRASAPPAR